MWEFDALNQRIWLYNTNTNWSGFALGQFRTAQQAVFSSDFSFRGICGGMGGCLLLTVVVCEVQPSISFWLYRVAEEQYQALIQSTVVYEETTELVKHKEITACGWHSYVTEKCCYNPVLAWLWKEILKVLTLIVSKCKYAVTGMIWSYVVGKNSVNKANNVFNFSVQRSCLL